MTIYNLVFKQQDNGGSLCTASVVSGEVLPFCIAIELDPNSTIGNVRDELKKKANHMSREDIMMKYNNIHLDDDTECISLVETSVKYKSHHRGMGARDRLAGKSASINLRKHPNTPPSPHRVRSPVNQFPGLPPAGYFHDNEQGLPTPPRRRLSHGSDISQDSRQPFRYRRHTPPRGRESPANTPPLECSNDYSPTFDAISSPANSDPNTPPEILLAGSASQNPLQGGTTDTNAEASKPKSIPAKCVDLFGLPAIIGGVCCCIGLAFLIVGIILVAGDTLSSGECNSSHHSWMFTCAFNDGSGSFPVGWYSKPTLLVNWGESGRLGVFDPPKTLQPNSSCESGIGIGGYYPSVPSDQCVEYCTHWCRVKEHQVLKDGSAATGSICCEATTEPTCTCTAHKHPSVVVVGNTSSYAVEYKFTLSESSDVIEKENRHCSNISMNGIDTEDNCYIQSFRMLSSLLKPFPCHTDDYVPRNGRKDDRCFYGSVSDDTNPTVGVPILVIGLSITGIILCIISALQKNKDPHSPTLWNPNNRFLGRF